MRKRETQRVMIFNSHLQRSTSSEAASYQMWSSEKPLNTKGSWILKMLPEGRVEGIGRCRGREGLQRQRCTSDLWDTGGGNDGW